MTTNANASDRDAAIDLRPIEQADWPQISALNNAAIPAVPYTDPAGIGALLRWSDLKLAAVAADDRSRVLGFVIALPAGSGYDSENYRWFENLARPHVYVDRIVIGENTRGLGVGKVLYQAVFDHARARNVDRVTCEVNTDPPNPGSMRFHSRLGFKELGRQGTKDNTVTVALLAADVTAA